MRKIALLYTMKTCPFCTEMKGMLKENKIKYLERDIDKYEKEYNEFVKTTKNDYLPAFSILTLNENDKIIDVEYIAPEDNFKNLEEGVQKVKEVLLN
jgi:glutaredoxin